jgi:hypothetical protein
MFFSYSTVYPRATLIYACYVGTLARVRDTWVRSDVTVLTAFISISWYDHAVLAATNRVCGPMVKVSGSRRKGPGFDSGRYQIF